MFEGGNPYENINAALSRLGISTAQRQDYESKFGITVTNKPVPIGSSNIHPLIAGLGTLAPVLNTQPTTEEDTMVTPILSAVMGAALSVAPAKDRAMPFTMM